jgi:CMP-2-keto-3-deoxyoctulosonic acid synthetase
MVDVVADLEWVIVRLDGRVIADHSRSWGNALTITDPDHVSAAARLREAFQTPRVIPVETAVVLRDLAEYDSAFGVDIEVAS